MNYKLQIDSLDKKILSILRQEVPLKIVLYLIKNDNSKHKQILKNVDVSPSTLSYHLKKLVNSNIIYSDPYAEEKGYKIIDKEKLIRILLEYEPYNLFDSFNDVWLDLSVE